LANSGKQVKDALSQGAVLINGQAVTAADNGQPERCFAAEAAMHSSYFLVRLGKKKYHLFCVSG